MSADECDSLRKTYELCVERKGGRNCITEHKLFNSCLKKNAVRYLQEGGEGGEGRGGGVRGSEGE